MITVKDIAWLAGLLEGEGSFTDEGNSPRIQLKMTDKDIVDRARILLGSDVLETYTFTNGNKTAYVTRIQGNKAIQWMFTIFPLLGERRRVRVRSIINSWKTRYKRDVGVDYCSKGHPLLIFGKDFRYTETKGSISKRCMHCQRIRNSKHTNRHKRVA